MYENSGVHSYAPHLGADMMTLPDWVAAETEYVSAYFGKWHVGSPEDLFNSRFHYTHAPYEGGPMFKLRPPWRPGERPVPGAVLSSASPGYADDWVHARVNSMWHPGTYLAPLVESLAGGHAGTLDLPMESFPDVVVARYTQEFVRAHDADSPFIAFCSFPGPHWPGMVPHEFGIRYDPAEMPLWANRHDRFEGKPINQKKLRLLQSSPRGAPYRPSGDDGELQELLAGRFSYLELIDGMVGEVLDTLTDLGLYENTIIILTSDHGVMAGSHGFASMGSYMYDELYRIPLLLKPAGTPAHRRASEPVHLMDLTVTLMHAMSGEQQTAMGAQALHGQSLLPLIESESEWPRAVHFAEYHGDWYGHYSVRMVTDGQWKLVWNLSDLCELYDLEHDPGELTNLFYDPRYGKVRDRYFALLLQEAERLGDGHVRLLWPDIEKQLGAALDGPVTV